VGLDLATVLAQWAAGGLACLWVTTRRRQVGAGYGWLLRSVYGAFAVGAFVAGVANNDAGSATTVRDVAALMMAIVALGALTWSVTRRTGTYPPGADLVAPAIGLVAVGNDALTCARFAVGALFLGAVSDAMMLGHWYLVQPGLGREPIRELVRLVGIVWPFEVVLLLVPTGMAQVLSGSIDDGYGGLIGWMWVLAAVSTIGLVVATWLALRERYYSAVMAATGLLYLAILTAFGTDVMARAVLAP
jgi:hypothetical protein